MKKSLYLLKKIAKTSLISLTFILTLLLNSLAEENISLEPQNTFLEHQKETQIIPEGQNEIINVAEEKSKTEVKDKKSGVKKIFKDEKTNKLYLEFREADIKEVARIFSKLSGVSILVSEDVKARVTLNIENLTWREAFELILKTYNLYSIEKNGVIIIVTYKKIQEEQDQSPLTTKILTLNFVDLNEAKIYLKSLMTKRGTLEGDKRTNSLIITDTPEVIEKAEKILKELDKKTPQVLVEVWMIDKKLTSEFEFGIEWSYYDKASLDTTGTPTKMWSQSLGVTKETLNIIYGKSVFQHFWLSGILQAYKEDGNSKILANPRVLTLDNIPAEINITEQVPYTDVQKTQDGSMTSTQFKDVGIKLIVKPHITPDGHVVMDISTEQSFVNRFITDSSGSQQPEIATRKSQNTMLVKDQETIVIGGLRKRERKTTNKKIPILGDIPFLGNLFRNTQNTDEIRELIIFVTPIIIKDTKDIVKEDKEILNGKQFFPEEKIKEESKNIQTKNDLEIKDKEKIDNVKKKEELPNFKKLKLLPLKAP